MGVFSISSCVVSENVEFNEDFSGTYDVKFGMDFGFLLKYFADEGDDSSMVNGSSIIYFDDLFAESSGSDSENIDNTEVEFTKEIHLLNAASEVAKPRVKTAAGFEFENLEALSASLSQSFISNLLTPEDRSLHAYKKSTIQLAKQKLEFSRKSIIVEEQEKPEDIEISDGENSKGFESSNFAMNYFKYRSSYRFPRKVNSVKSGNVIVGDDKKTILLKSFSAGKIAKDPNLLDFELTFEE